MARADSQALTLEAHAKVNLCLAIGYPPHDGYHPVRSVFQELDLHDTVCVKSVVADGACDLVTAAGTPVMLSCSVGGLNPADNLVFRALDAAERACGTPAVEPGHALSIDIEKRIFAGGGLGGGSSDAAAMLKAYAQMVGIDACDQRLMDVARSLGADVAFFLHGGAALMGGRGDVLESALPVLDAPVVLMGGAQSLATPCVYRAFDDDPQPAPDVDALARALLDDPGDIERVARLCANNLGPAACALDACIQPRLELAQECPGVLCALVSGSGSTSFAICVDDHAAQRLAREVAPLCGWVHVCGTDPILA